MAKNGITFSWNLDGVGGGQRVATGDIEREVENDGLTWVHINDTGRSARQWMEKSFSYLDRIIMDALLEEETHPRFLQHNNGLLLILRGVNLNPEQAPEDMVSLRVWIDAQRIITVERRKVQTIQEIDTLIANGEGPKSAGEFLTKVTDHLFDHMQAIMSRLHDKLDLLEDKLADDPDTVSQGELTALRRSAMTFHRYVSPQREVLAYLRNADLQWLSDIDKRDFAEDWDQIKHMLEDLDFLRDRARIIYDELMSLTNNKVNKNLYMLSAIATIFMPLTFVTGLMGMNVAGIPGSHDPHAFLLVSAISIGMGLLIAIIFRLLKWF
jgi:zinc transporter